MSSSHRKLWFFKTSMFAFSMLVEGAAVEAGKIILFPNALHTQQMFTLSNKLPSLTSEKFQQMRTFPTDCTLVCRNGRVGAHRLILSAASSFFMVTMVQSSGSQIFLPQYDVQDIRLIVDFMYGLSVTVDYDRMNRLVDIAHDLGINVFANGEGS
ncbi:unnamed protein product [Larinioides sclopetarius]